MAVKAERNISLDLLKRYDINIKKYIRNENEANQRVIFDEKSNFPIIGNSKVLYIDGSDIYIWNLKENKYTPITGNQTIINKTLEWNNF